MQDWLIYAFMTVIFWGFWGFLPKLSTRFISARSAWVTAEIGAVITIVLISLLLKISPQFHQKGTPLALLTGVVVALGGMFFTLAISKGKASIIVPLTSLYPVITVILAILFLRESLTVKQILGIVSALIAVFLFSM